MNPVRNSRDKHFYNNIKLRKKQRKISNEVKINADPKKIEKVLTRRVEQILPSKEGLKALIRRKKIRLYLGIDPTGTKLHLGHTITLRKLQEFAELGHETILVVGSGTVLAGGDPSARDKTRPLITEKEIKKNIATWKKQARKILDFSKVKIKYNGDWLLRLNLKKIIQIASHISAIKLFQRDMFQKRLKKRGTVWAHETLYPLLQGYDSVVLDVDLEIGGTDQLFNMFIGRELQQKMRNKEKSILTVPMVLGTDGKLMSKTSRNCVWLTDSANQMFGKIMSIPDNLIISYFELLTNLPPELIQRHKRALHLKKVNPMILKRQLAFEIVKMYHLEKAAKAASEEFNRIFKEKKLPSKISQIQIKEKSLDILELLVKTKLASSKSEAKRLILQKGVRINGKIQKNWQKIIQTKKGQVVQVGKRKVVKVI
jgi:tyrosyl-tRNA synthetase